MPRRPILLPLLIACLCAAPTAAGDPQKPRQHFAAHCDYAELPNFLIPLKSIAARDGFSLDASAPPVATLSHGEQRVLTRFGQPGPNDVDVTRYGAADRQADDAYGRIVALFRFCDPLH